jgi:hypothetical protein
MTNTGKELEELLNDIEEKCNPQIGAKESIDFMLECLSLIRHKLPPASIEAVEVLQAYFMGRVTIEAVNDMLVECWRRIDEDYKGVDARNSEVSAIRAVIFPLNAQRRGQERDIVDHLSSFLTFVNQVEPHLKEEEELLRRHFAKCI